MEILIIFLIFLELINYSLNYIPFWDITNSSNLLLSYGKENFTIYNKTDYNLNAILDKEIEINDNSIKEQNYMQMVNDEDPLKTNWENIYNSEYITNKGHFVCPKGRFFFTQYRNHKFEEKIPNNMEFDKGDDFELKCYYLKDSEWVFQIFLNRKINANFCGKYIEEIRDKEEQIWWNPYQLGNGVYDLIISNNHTNLNYKTIALMLENEGLVLKNMILDNNNGKYDFTYSGITKKILLDKNLSFVNAYFNPYTNVFYWMTYNSTDEYKSGYSETSIDVEKRYSEENLTLIKNDTSPFFFIFNSTVDTMKMIRNTKYAYYKINYLEQTYYGIIDIKLNQIIFNTNETLEKFTPFRNYSILAYYKGQAYEICTIKDKDNKCLDNDECPSNQILVLDTEKGNYCADTQECNKTILKPYNICISSCNEDFLVSKDKECGLCKNIFPNISEYKIMNKPGCSKIKPNGTYYINEKMKILGNCPEFCKVCSNSFSCEKCNEGYNLENEKCEKIECYDNCELCFSTSEDEYNQSCISCKNDLKLYEDSSNCFKNCSDGHYENDIYCSKCHSNCKTCLKGPENDKNDINQNCETCNSNWNYLIKAEGFPRNCVNDCPSGTKPNNNYCVKVEEKEDKNKSKNETIIIIFIIVFACILLILLLYIYIRICKINKRDHDLISDIYQELLNTK